MSWTIDPDAKLSGSVNTNRVVGEPIGSCSKSRIETTVAGCVALSADRPGHMMATALSVCSCYELLPNAFRCLKTREETLAWQEEAQKGASRSDNAHRRRGALGQWEKVQFSPRLGEFASSIATSLLPALCDCS